KVEAADAGLLCTDNEVLFVNAQGVQRAPLSEITKVSRDGPDLVLSGANQTFVRGSIAADKLTLANFFAEVKAAVGQARGRREVLMEAPPTHATQNLPSQPTASISSLPSAVTTPEIGRSQAAPPFAAPVMPLEASVAAPRMAEPSGFTPSLSSVSVNEGVTSFQPASFWWRVLAYIIDYLIVGAASSVLFLILGGGSILSLLATFSEGRATNDTAFISSIAGLVGAYLFWGLLTAIGTWLYYALLESSPRQATLGKLATGLFVSNINGERISFGQASGRYWSKVGVPIAAGFVVGLISLPFGDSGVAGLLQLLLIAGLLYTYVMCALTPRKQTLYDQISGTLVWKR
ncbi:MAG: hypothetical protein HC933_11875, partial [Pleurocapsa sp. SU_196_0]|nr:hypothetical protein [Pleurocapsa sp. SU_196_0]